MSDLPDEKKMPRRLKGRWLRALRSGKYKQCTGELRRRDEFCCLGVLCDVIDPKSWRKPVANSYEQKRHTNGELLPAHVMKLTGIDANTAWSLSLKNDGLPSKPRMSFKQIASWIEKNL